MTADEIRAHRNTLGLSEVDFGRALRLEDPRKKTRELENGARIASPQMIAIIEGLLKIQALENDAPSGAPSR